MIGLVSCPHIADIDQNKFQEQFSEEIEHRSRIQLECYICERTGQNLWICLHSDCFKVFCSDLSPNHVLCHYKRDVSHCLHMNLANLRLWCQECNGEILYQREELETGLTPRGLVGLQNLGNTCYMSAALQALAHTPPLADHFIQASAASLSPSKIGPLTSSFTRLLADLWTRPGGYVAPAALLHAVRHSHPMYRGFQQHDSQEFLRCLLDQLHEEMKIPALEPLRQDSYASEKEDDLSDFENASSENEEYETCDSGVSERSSLSDEPFDKMTISRSSSPIERSPRKSQVHLNPLGTPSKLKKQIIYKSIVSDVFDGTLLSSVQCLTCNRVSSRVETFQDLSLPIPGRETIYILHRGIVNQVNNGPYKCSHLVSADQGWLSWFWDWVCSWLWGPQVSLHDCLSAFFSADELKGDNMYSCEKCGKLRNGVKYSRLVWCPEVLCIHLKRFRHDPTLPSKISSHVSFPLSGLDLAPYLETDSGVGITKYDLVSVICHHGQGGASGHYTCLAKNRDTGLWYEYDDHSVTAATSVASSRAYVLFYRKDNSKMNRARKRAARLEELSSGEKERFHVCKDWLVRFNSFSEPGPIDNRLVICQHDSLLPGADTVVLSATVWNYLLTRFGGGPEVPFDKYSPCEVCSQLCGEPHLLRLQFHEFTRLQDEGSGSHNISLTWLSSWETYIKGHTGLGPGPVTTSGDTCVVSTGQWDLLTGLYGLEDLKGSPRSRSADEKGSLGNMDSGIWVQNGGQDKESPGVNWSIEMPREGE